MLWAANDSLRIIYGMRMVLPEKRVLQVAEDEIVIDYACMARKAGIWVKILSLRGLRNTLLCRVDFCFAAILEMPTFVV